MGEKRLGGFIPGGAGDIVFSEEEALELVGGEQDFLVEMVGVLLEQIPECMEGIRGAVRRGSAEELNSQAHRFKGSVSSLGARNVAAVCQELEDMGASGDLSRSVETLALLEAEVARLLPVYDEFLARTTTAQA